MSSLAELTPALLAAAVNGLLQGLVVALVALALLRYMPTNARSRFVIGWSALALVALLPLAHLVPTLAAHGRLDDSAVALPASADVGAATAARETAVLAPGTPQQRQDKVSTPVGAPTMQRISAASERLERGERSAMSKRPLWTVSLPIATALAAITLWLAVALGRAMGLLRGLAHLLELKHTATPMVEGEQRLRRWLSFCPTRRPVHLACSSEVQTPVALGFLQPTILIPQRLEARLEQGDLDQLGVHELAHLVRRDDWTQLAEKLLEAIYWFHPGVRLLARWLGFQRELACDEIAVGWTRQPKSYARCLLRLLRSGDHAAPVSMAAGAAANRSQASRRIEVLLRQDPELALTFSRPLVVAVAVILMTLGVVLLWAPPLFSFERASRFGFEENVNGGSTHIRVEDGRSTIELWLDGDVTFADDLASIRSMTPGSRFKLRQRDGLRVRSLSVRAEETGLEYEYASMGVPRDFDDAARSWFREILPAAIAHTGLGARDRAEKIFARGGADALLDEVASANGDRARLIGLEVLLEEATLSATQLHRIAALTTDLEQAEHRRLALLDTLVHRGWLPSVAGSAFFDAVRSLESEHRRAALLDLALRREPPSGALLPSYFEVLDAFPSEFRRAALLDRLLEQPDLSSASLILGIGVLGRLPSEHVRASLLTAQVARLEAETPALGPFFDALARLPSEHRRQALVERLLARGDAFVITNARRLLDAIASLPSEHRRQELLARLLQPLLDSGRPDAEELTDPWFDLVAQLPSEHRVAELLNQVLRLDDLSQQTLGRVLAITKARVASPHRRAPLIEEITDRLLARAA